MHLCGNARFPSLLLSIFQCGPQFWISVSLIVLHTMNVPCGLQCGHRKFPIALRPRTAVALSGSALAQVRIPTWNCPFKFSVWMPRLSATVFSWGQLGNLVFPVGFLGSLLSISPAHRPFPPLFFSLHITDSPPCPKYPTLCKLLRSFDFLAVFFSLMRLRGSCHFKCSSLWCVTFSVHVLFQILGFFCPRSTGVVSLSSHGGDCPFGGQLSMYIGPNAN